MKKIIENIGCGYVYKNIQKTQKVFAFNNICDIIIPLFKKYPIKGIKLKY